MQLILLLYYNYLRHHSSMPSVWAGIAFGYGKTAFTH
jgi:hypothetical protein